MVFEIFRMVLVIVLLGVAAAILTPKGRVPLALRGILRTVASDGAKIDERGRKGAVSWWRKCVALLLVFIAAALIAVGKI